MKPLVVFAAIACALSACSSGLGGGASLPPPSGTEPSNTGTEPTGGGIEPGVSGNDPPPTAGGGETIAQLCAQFCNRAAGACGSGDAAQCAASCTDEITSSGSCQPLYVDALHCLITQPLTCDGTNIMSPNCTSLLLAAGYCVSSTTPPPTTGGGTPTGA
jgi:hypothetical protein